MDIGIIQSRSTQYGGYSIAKKDYFLIVDSESTNSDKVADFGALVVDRKGNIYTECAILVRSIFDNKEDHCLFSKIDAGHFAKSTLESRYQAYNEMLGNGSRMLASVAAINRWLARVVKEYNPILTAYNLAFDVDKCRNTGIDLDMFDKRFCLWYASYTKWAHTKQYKEMVLTLHAFNNTTTHGNMSYKTNAETMARFVTGNPEMPDEPHTAIEDARDYELPILMRLVRTTKRLQFMEPTPYNWREVQVKNHFKPV